MRYHHRELERTRISSINRREFPQRTGRLRRACALARGRISSANFNQM